MTTRMHADELDLPVDLVRTLLAEQLPQLGRPPRPARRVQRHRQRDVPARRRPGGPDAAHPLGRRHASTTRSGGCRRLDGLLPVTIPRVLAVGTPAAGYPWTWSVLTWVPGDNPVLGGLRDPETLARDLAALVRALRALPLDDGTVKDGRAGRPRRAGASRHRGRLRRDRRGRGHGDLGARARDRRVGRPTHLGARRHRAGQPAAHRRPAHGPDRLRGHRHRRPDAGPRRRLEPPAAAGPGGVPGRARRRRDRPGPAPGHARSPRRWSSCRTTATPTRCWPRTRGT